MSTSPYYKYKHVRISTVDPGVIQQTLDHYTGLPMSSYDTKYRVHTIDFRGSLCDIVFECVRQARS